MFKHSNKADHKKCLFLLTPLITKIPPPPPENNFFLQIVSYNFFLNHLSNTFFNCFLSQSLLGFVSFELNSIRFIDLDPGSKQTIREPDPVHKNKIIHNFFKHTLFINICLLYTIIE